MLHFITFSSAKLSWRTLVAFTVGSHIGENNVIAKKTFHSVIG
jgi:hypothetical protein